LGECLFARGHDGMLPPCVRGRTMRGWPRHDCFR
jgi:hypothetical protein